MSKMIQNKRNIMEKNPMKMQYKRKYNLLWIVIINRFRNLT